MTTPESIEAILLRKAAWQQFFAGLSSIIIDEAHNFAAGDRGGHLISLLERIEQGIGHNPQRIALSATVANIEDFSRWLAGGNRQPGRVVSVPASPKDKDFEIALFDEEQDAVDCAKSDKAAFHRFGALCGLLKGKRSIVFVRSRRGAEELAQAFAAASGTDLARHLKIRTHHSAVSKFFREAAETLIQQASEDGINAILSTSTLELGVDIGELDRVVQMGALVSSSAFLQRVGRTGRRVGRPQYFRGLCTKLDDLVLLSAVVSLGIQGVSEAIPLRRRCFHLLAHQLICLALQNNGVHPDRAWSTRSTKIKAFPGDPAKSWSCLRRSMK